MKINHLNEAALAAAAAATAAHGANAAKTDRSGGSSTVAGVTPAAQDATVTVSAAAQSLSASAAGSGSGIDQTKVAAMKAAIADGSFKVDAGAIADKLLSNAQEFLSRARS
jgi:negative regulator of flagellin synthesis FlgM